MDTPDRDYRDASTPSRWQLIQLCGGLRQPGNKCNLTQMRPDAAANIIRGAHHSKRPADADMVVIVGLVGLTNGGHYAQFGVAV